MNILIRSRGKEDFAGYHYIVNRKPKSRTTSIEKSLGGYNWTTCGKAKYTVNDNLMQLTIPLANLGLSATDFEIEFKVADHVTKYDDIMDRSEEHTSELQSLMRISYAVFCLKK